MENSEPDNVPQIAVKPAALFAFMRITALLLFSLALLWIAWRYWPGMIWLSILSVMLAIYRYFYIRKIMYIITAEYLQIKRGLFFRRTDTIELFRVKDYVLMQPFLLQILGLMDLQLITTDPVNRIVWLRGIPVSNLVETIRERVLATRRHNRIYEIN